MASLLDNERPRAAKCRLAAGPSALCRSCSAPPRKAAAVPAAQFGKDLDTADAQTKDLKSLRPSNAGEEKLPFCLDGSSCVGYVPDTHELVLKD